MYIGMFPTKELVCNRSEYVTPTTFASSFVIDGCLELLLALFRQEL
jgi:hypothetical protein